MLSSLRGRIGQTSVPVADITLTSADHVATGHALDSIRVSMTTWKIMWSSYVPADKDLMNRHKRPTDV